VAEARSHLRRVNREIEVFRELRRRVLTGVYRPGERLPSMAALGEEFVVTESIVQKAVARLRELGLLRTDPGRGTWVVDAITDRATMRTVLDAARGGVFLDAMWGPDAGEIVEFPAAWIARLLDESDAPERLT
jgi:DNA-binding FadR family transcriptional regulator